MRAGGGEAGDKKRHDEGREATSMVEATTEAMMGMVEVSGMAEMAGMA